MTSLSRERAIELNTTEYGQTYELFKWVTSEEAEKAAREREQILQSLRGKARFGYHDTKIYSGELSPGCSICAAGAWSCLFINSVCNAHCFYCPSEQTSTSEPTTNGIVFANPQDYLDYLDRFEFKGVSISGGEPFLTFDRTCLFLTKIKKRFGREMYVWMYTNGMAVTREKLERLRDADLDEIRFDISAHQYHMDHLQMAVKVMTKVTVEIPSIPEDHEGLKACLPQLEEMGVKHLHLHDLRCTPYNCLNLIGRGYTFLHGAKVTVLGSELSALRLIAYAFEKGIALPINYCSFIYKDQFQTVGQRRRLARFVSKPFETITAAGMIRKISLTAEPAEIAELVRRLENHGFDKEFWRLESGGKTLSIHEQLLPHVEPKLYEVDLTYSLPALMPAVSYGFPFEEIALNRKKHVVVERRSARKEKFTGLGGIASILDPHSKSRGRPMDNTPDSGRDDILDLEEIGWGLQEYY